MTIYADRLRPWAIYQLIPQSESVLCCRLRSRTDADAYASVLRQGGGTFEVVFDQVEDACNSSNNQAIASDAAIAFN